VKQFYSAVCLFVALAWTGNVFGSTVSDGGIGSFWPGGIEATQTLDTASVVSGTFAGAVLSSLPTTNFVAAGLNQNQAIGTLGWGLSANAGVAMGDTNDAHAIRGTFRMSLSGRLIKDVTGADLYVSETGSNGGPEAFMLRVSTDGGATFTPWQYRQAQVQYDPDGDGACDFFTGFDLVSDFGLAAGSLVSHVEIQNANATDRVDNASGQGRVVFAGDSGYSSASTLTAGALNSAGNIAYSNSRFDPDPTYVFYSAAVAVPEPSSLVILLVGGLSAILAVAIRKMH